LLATACSWASNLIHTDRCGLLPHYERRRIESLINRDRDQLKEEIGDFPDVVKIAQTFFHSNGKLPSDRFEGCI
jgi:hypothetical protein